MEKKQVENGKDNIRKTSRNSLTYKLYMREVLIFCFLFCFFASLFVFCWFFLRGGGVVV